MLTTTPSRPSDDTRVLHFVIFPDFLADKGFIEAGYDMHAAHPDRDGIVGLGLIVDALLFCLLLLSRIENIPVNPSGI